LAPAGSIEETDEQDFPKRFAPFIRMKKEEKE
jgi:hypothetical protein